ncbi:pyrroloquinoline quinone biosynthesis peptide chaperone PqqD [Falsiroseomonas sp.]|uniref:pyrroloquinoline quinone biosynthesis peptide chaperone PqqD n=1 Tax=Falsiroseomonas sp. TaxID=2870721 RepID=UPI003F71073D
MNPATVPALRRGVRLRQDAARDRWVVMAPERMLVPDETALAVLRLVDGTRSLGEITAELARAYAAPEAVIAEDVAALLTDLADKGLVSLA